MNLKFRVFIAGIIQGSIKETEVHGQAYRSELKQILAHHFPDAEIYCPVENHPDSISYDDKQARKVFLDHLQMVRESDLLVVYIPEASMGSAIEMWEAFHQPTLIVSITPMAANWVVRILSDTVCADMAAFTQLVNSGELGKLLEERLQSSSTVTAD